MHSPSPDPLKLVLRFSCLLSLFVLVQNASADPVPVHDLNVDKNLNGIPISSDLSTEETLTYFQPMVAKVVNRNRNVGNLYPYIQDYDAQLVSIDKELTPWWGSQFLLSVDVKALGLRNLLSLCAHMPSAPQNGEYDLVASCRYLAWRQILAENIQNIAKDQDISAVVDAVSQCPDLFIILSNKGWAGRPELDDLLDTTLQKPPRLTSFSTLLVPLELAEKSTDIRVKNDLLKRLQQYTDDSVSNRATLSTVIFFCLKSTNPQIQQFLPSLLLQVSHTPPNDITQEYISFAALVAQMDLKPTCFAVPGFFKAAQTFYQNLTTTYDSSHYYPGFYYSYNFFTTIRYFGARLGDKDAFRSFLDILSRPNDGNFAAASKILSCVDYSGPDDKLTGCLKDQNLAVFNSTLGRWQIKDKDSPANAIASSANPQNSSLPSATANPGAFVDRVVEQWYADHPNPSALDAETAANVIQQQLAGVDLTALLTLCQMRLDPKHSASVDYDALAGTSLEGIKNRVICLAIKARLTDDNLPAFLKAVADDQNLAPLIFSHTEWNEKTELGALAVGILYQPVGTKDYYGYYQLSPEYHAAMTWAALSDQPKVHTALILAAQDMESWAKVGDLNDLTGICENSSDATLNACVLPLLRLQMNRPAYYSYSFRHSLLNLWVNQDFYLKRRLNRFYAKLLLNGRRCVRTK